MKDWLQECTARLSVHLGWIMQYEGCGWSCSPSFSSLPMSDAARGCSVLTRQAKENSTGKAGMESEGVFGVQAMVRDHAGDSRWGAHAHAIANGNMWKPPGNGGHDDKVWLVPSS